MADNLFGTPVTDATVKLYYPDIKEITAKDRAQVAFQLKEADQKSENADIRYKDYDFHGHIGEAPYPNEIQNGQWAAFLHVHTSGTLRGSSAAIVYSGRNSAGDKIAWLNAWSNPFHGTNCAYTEVRPTSHFDTGGVWDAVESLFKTDNFSDNEYGGYTIASIGQSYPI
ncbi:23 kDa jasmonate-induced protein [Ziziphus jujuba]|uniref:23 kDa jasmonate-induced protein n=1 Tax=Ziziphus jujuba TaxID=326968 RepID=A0ABM4AFQ8_ZIZJJ|nr:23 kDa jasmonate-induced protein [Ziziphus jujuba]